MNKNTNPASEYNEALSFLFSQLPMFSRVGAPAYKPGLDTSIALDNYFGNPHRKFKSIHVGGTNGKGSTSHSIAAVLQAQGYKTALYTSPHLADFRERMRINGRMIPEKDVVDFVDRWKKSGYEGHPSFFELTMMMAFDWFAREQVDYAVIEVGMGGRLDSTNIITPMTTVITNISFDHTQFLGHTLPEIAREKAGIIKSGIPAVIGRADGDVEKVFDDRAMTVGTSLRKAWLSDSISSTSHDLLKGWDCETSRYGRIHFPLAGEYQLENLKTILEAVEAMKDAGIEIEDASLKSGLENVVNLTGFMGRWSVISTDSPTVVCDTGHNEDGLRHNMHQLREIMNQRPEAKLHIVAGFVADKAVDEILPLFIKDADYYITQAQIPRAMPVATLAGKVADIGFRFSQYPDVAEAYEAALAKASPEDVVFVGGSTFIVADLLKHLSDRR